eukprot:jgi/Undpi1/14024/HiC_scaffold_9.g03675.m1
MEEGAGGEKVQKGGEGEEVEEEQEEDAEVDHPSLHPLVLSGRRVWVISPVVGWASVWAESKQSILTPVGAKGSGDGGDGVSGRGAGKSAILRAGHGGLSIPVATAPVNFGGWGGGVSGPGDVSIGGAGNTTGGKGSPAALTLGGSTAAGVAAAAGSTTAPAGGATATVPFVALSDLVTSAPIPGGKSEGGSLLSSPEEKGHGTVCVEFGGVGNGAAISEDWVVSEEGEGEEEAGAKETE